MPLINCEVSLTLTWSENCVLTDITTQTARAAQGDNPARPAINAPTNATFQIKDTKLYVPVVTLSTENDKKLLEQLKTGFKRTIKWNKYRSEMTNQTKNNNLNYLIDLTGGTFQITDTKLYVSAVTLSTENDKRLLEQAQNLKELLNGINIGQK